MFLIIVYFSWRPLFYVDAVMLLLYVMWLLIRSFPSGRYDEQTSRCECGHSVYRPNLDEFDFYCNGCDRPETECTCGVS
jgi:hypothetical protein